MKKLKVNHFAVSGGGGFHDRFAEGWVWVDCFDEFMAGAFELAGQDQFGNHFRHIGPNHVSAQDFTVFGGALSEAHAEKICKIICKHGRFSKQIFQP